MRAREIVGALGGKWFSTYGMVKCVAHDDGKPSLKLCDGEEGRLLVFCHVGCEPHDVLGELRRRGYLDGSPGDEPHDEERSRRIRETAERDRQRRIALVRRIWKETLPAAGTPVEVYLRNRGISDPIPPTLRYHPRLEFKENNAVAAAMVAAVQDIDRAIIGIHRTYLTAAGEKAFGSDSKKMLGPLGGGAVRLAKASPDRRLVIAEGIETALAVQQASGLPAWAALSTSGIRGLALPQDNRNVVICADNDENGAGERAAKAAAERWTIEGRSVRIAIPQRRPDQQKVDWLDVLNGNTTAHIQENINAA